MLALPNTVATLTLILALGHLVADVNSVSLDLFYPFGDRVDDLNVEPGDDLATEEISLEESVVLYNSSYKSIY
ncbi:nidogen-1, partial [Biomphalaria glabrata]